MSADRTVAALLSAWPKLPDLAGADWPRLYWQGIDCLRAYLNAADDNARAAAANALLTVLSTAPDAVRIAVREELRQIRVDADQERGGAPGGSAGESLSNLVREQARHLSQPSTETRYTDVQCPAQVQTGKRFAIIVGLTRGRSEDAEDPLALQAEPNKLIKVVLTPQEPLESVGDRERELPVEADRDSPPVVFYLRAREAGLQRVLLDFYDARTLLVSQNLAIEAVSGLVSEVLAKPATAPAHIGDYLAPHPDLILRIITQGNRLKYDLHFGDTRMLTVDGEPLRADPREFRKNVLTEISNLRAGRDVQGATISDDEVIQGIARIGLRLYRQLFPEALRREYCRFRHHVRTLQIISDEPWIPWEIIKPYERDDFDGRGFQDDFLCMQYELSRWVMPGKPPSAEIAARSLVCVAPVDSGLSAAQRERASMQGLARATGATDLSPAVSSRAHVLSLLEGDTPIAVWHFACHGNYVDADPDNSPLTLEAHQLSAPAEPSTHGVERDFAAVRTSTPRTSLYPNDLIGPEVEQRLATDRPLVFLNACRAGSLGLSLTGLGGWAHMLVGECHVGALIAPLWEVSDEPARQFAEVFYEHTRDPTCTLAQAVNRARTAVRESYPHNPSWLAYSLYGHPNARLKWAAGGGEANTPITGDPLRRHLGRGRETTAPATSL